MQFSSPMPQHHQGYLPYMPGPYAYSHGYEGAGHPGFRGLPSVMMQNYPGYLPAGYSFPSYGGKAAGGEEGEKASRSSPTVKPPPAENKALELLQQHASQYKSKSPQCRTTSPKRGRGRDPETPPPNACCPPTITWGTLCWGGSTTCPTPQVRHTDKHYRSITWGTPCWGAGRPVLRLRTTCPTPQVRHTDKHYRSITWGTPCWGVSTTCPTPQVRHTDKHYRSITWGTPCWGGRTTCPTPQVRHTDKHYRPSPPSPGVPLLGGRTTCPTPQVRHTDKHYRSITWGTPCWGGRTTCPTPQVRHTDKHYRPSHHHLGTPCWGGRTTCPTPQVRHTDKHYRSITWGTPCWGGRTTCPTPQVRHTDKYYRSITWGTPCWGGRTTCPTPQVRHTDKHYRPSHHHLGYPLLGGQDDLSYASGETH
ncbi:hypothetical protein F7725_023470 [Dissostichus mawsoni]|uniref:Uncharacterized protein n=1 Tax=Dissostichus mawsoni TaxID=36200 RepID=A0A7J5Z0U1_DISMA|nr:hypothetical protein F7725_023470 [Dissostichus mawsoni]